MPVFQGSKASWDIAPRPHFREFRNLSQKLVLDCINWLCGQTLSEKPRATRFRGDTEKSVVHKRVRTQNRDPHPRDVLWDPADKEQQRQHWVSLMTHWSFYTQRHDEAAWSSSHPSLGRRRDGVNQAFGTPLPLRGKWGTHPLVHPTKMALSPGGARIFKPLLELGVDYQCRFALNELINNKKNL